MIYELLLCSDLNYRDKSYVQYCGILINIKLVLSNLPKHKTRLNDVIIIGLNDRNKSLHKDVGNAFLFWHDQNKPWYGNNFEK